jgi:hypothetical protein
MRWFAALLLLSSVAVADEAIQFHAPAGWSVDGSMAKAAEFGFFAVEDKSGVRMLAKIENDPIAATDDAVGEFMKGAQSGGARVTEVRHDFPEIAGRRSIRILFDITDSGVTTRNVGYLMPAGRQTAFVMFVSTQAVEARLADFDKIAAATKLPPPPPSLTYRIVYATGQLLGIGAVIGLIVFFVVRASRKPTI